MTTTIGPSRCARRSPTPSAPRRRGGDAIRLFVALSALILLAVASPAPAARAEDGYDLWLRYRPVERPWADRYRPLATAVAPVPGQPILRAARAELIRGLTDMLGRAPAASEDRKHDGLILIGTPATSPLIAGLKLPLKDVGDDGYLIRSVTLQGHRLTVIASRQEAGVLYGVFHFLRLMQTRKGIDHLDLVSAPRTKLRILDHWDNLDRTVERGYAGASLWDWQTLPVWRDPRYTDYARADASIGVNGVVLNNVNAKAASLTPAYLEKAAALAEVFRPYGIKVYLSARFSAPIELGGLKSADPLDPGVEAWWKAKTDEIYRYIPDFGGFLVKADSEGQPGPQDYHRTHADGANMLAAALAPHHGVVMWRAFVYSSEQPEDRAQQAYSEFTPLDGQFRDNVILQVKNGAIDFQPREPFHPLFGAMPKTPLMIEFQVTKEYLGFSTHLAYLGPLYAETLNADTFAHGPGSTVAKVVDGTSDGHALTGMAGVANTGNDRNWSGSQFDQANWYVFGRLAWDPSTSPRDIAEDWARMTFSNDKAFVGPVVEMMMGSREAVVDYMTPLGLHHQMARSSHYGPGPWVSGGPRADWTSVYYNRADASGIGFDRTSTGSNAVAQYAPPVAAEFESLKRTPEKYLLWFHHLPWDYRTASGRILWDELVERYTRGVAEAAAMRETWAKMQPYVDRQRFEEISAYLEIQQNEAQWWRDASIAYFQSVSGRPLPKGYAPPPHDLAWYEARSFPSAPGSD
jgi:alpha-glucuronidase